MPPPPATLSAETVTVPSNAAVDTAFRNALRPAPAAPKVTAPAPLLTAKLVLPPDSVHAPPVSAVPKPPAAVRPNASAATTVLAGGASTVTARLTVPVAPSSSVTVRVTV